MLRDLPQRARWYIVAVVVLGAITFAALLPRGSFTPVLPLLVLVVLSSLFSAFKVHFPVASGSNMSVSYVVDIAALILYGPHTTMLVGAASGLSQSTLNARHGNPRYRTLFNMAILVLTAQAAGQVYLLLGGTPAVDLRTIAVPLVAMALAYFLVNTVPIAIAIALTTEQSAARIWRTDFASSVVSYVLGAAAAVVIVAVTRSSGYWLTLLLAAAPLYLTYKVYRAGTVTEARQGAILEAAHDAIVTTDQRLQIREFNPAAERMFGHRRSDILGRGVDLLFPAATRTVHTDALRQQLAGRGGPLSGRGHELSAIRADGTEFPVELSVARVAGDSRDVMTIFIRDITSRRVLEEQLRQSQKLEAIGRLAGGVAHDFNNLLMGIMGSADLLLMQLSDGDGAREEVSEIKRSVQRGAGLTRQLLAFSRRQVQKPTLLALDDVIAGMETLLRRLMGPEIELEIVRGTQPTRVIADQGQLEQVVLNLAVNGRDAMPDGGRLTIAVEQVALDDAAALAHVEGRDGRYARLRISDTGTGIDEHVRAKLFEPFFTTKEQGKGTGLGLSIVYGIVKQSGGYVSVISEAGHGATFLVHFPLDAKAAPAA